MMNKYFSILWVMVWLSACSDGEKENTPPSAGTALAVEGYVVKPQAYSEHLTVTGELRAKEQVELMSSSAGQVLDIYFKEGEQVKQGQPILRMDDRQWRAQLTGLKTEIDVAEKNYERKKSLLDIEGSTKQEVDEVFSTIETRKSQLQQLQLNIDLANIKAPFSGVIGMRNISKGAYLKAGDVITTLTQLNELKVDFELPQEHLSSIKVGNTVQVLINSDTVEAKVYAINPTIDRTSRTIQVRAIFEQKSSRIMPGTFAEVVIKTNMESDALLVPTQAIVPQINDQTIYLYKNGKVQRRIVETGIRTADKVRILSGVSAGDTVITSGLLMVKEGMSISFQAIQ